VTSSHTANQNIASSATTVTAASAGCVTIAAAISSSHSTGSATASAIETARSPRTPGRQVTRPAMIASARNSTGEMTRNPAAVQASPVTMPRPMNSQMGSTTAAGNNRR
jgi:hypothetical protein